MRLLLDVFIGFLLGSCILAYFDDFLKDDSLKKYEELLKRLKKVE